MSNLRAQLEQYRNHENMRKWLNLISTTEGSATFSNPYLAKGGTRNHLLATGYANHPSLVGNGDEAKWYFDDKTGKRLLSTANGRYMIKRDTWNGVNRALGGNLTFSPQDQDLAAIYLIHNRGALNDIISGRNADALRKLGPEWASLPSAPASYNQHKFSYDRFGRALKTVGFDPTTFGLNGQYKPLPNQPSQSATTMNNLGGSQVGGPAPMHFANSGQEKPIQNALDQDIKLDMPNQPRIPEATMFNGDQLSRMFGTPRKRSDFFNFN